MQIGHISLAPIPIRQTQTGSGQEPLNPCKHATEPKVIYFIPFKTSTLGSTALQHCCTASEREPASICQAPSRSRTDVRLCSCCWRYDIGLARHCVVKVGGWRFLHRLRLQNLNLTVLSTGGCKGKHEKFETGMARAMDPSENFLPHPRR